MGFGAPGSGAVSYKPTPPERGSFPLDHDGECKHLVSEYLKCLKSQRGVNDEQCRKLAKGYLGCRMNRNLMAPEEFKNLGLEFEDEKWRKDAEGAVKTTSKSTTGATTGATTTNDASSGDKA